MPHIDPPPLFSRMSHDAEMLELIEAFVDDLKAHAESLCHAIDSDRIDEIANLSHQLQGACGGYGFDTLGESAGRLSQLARVSESVSQIEREARELVELCQRADVTPARAAEK
jgi:HPt (histidine-containing phosphotransfer) domain-containing protein